MIELAAGCVAPSPMPTPSREIASRVKPVAKALRPAKNDQRGDADRQQPGADPAVDQPPERQREQRIEQREHRAVEQPEFGIADLQVLADRGREDRQDLPVEQAHRLGGGDEEQRVPPGTADLRRASGGSSAAGSSPSAGGRPSSYDALHFGPCLSAGGLPLPAPVGLSLQRRRDRLADRRRRAPGQLAEVLALAVELAFAGEVAGAGEQRRDRRRQARRLRASWRNRIRTG